MLNECVACTFYMLRSYTTFMWSILVARYSPLIFTHQTEYYSLNIIQIKSILIYCTMHPLNCNKRVDCIKIVKSSIFLPPYSQLLLLLWLLTTTMMLCCMHEWEENCLNITNKSSTSEIFAVISNRNGIIYGGVCAFVWKFLLGKWLQ